MRIQGVGTKQPKTRRRHGVRRTSCVRRNDMARSNAGMQSYDALYKSSPLNSMSNWRHYEGCNNGRGLRTRLRPLTNNLPKPMVPMANKPMMEHIPELLIRCKVTDIITLLYFNPEIIENYFGDGSRFDVKMTYLSAADDLGTAGSVKHAARYLDKSFLVISGDLLTDFDLLKALDFHKGQRAVATM